MKKILMVTMQMDIGGAETHILELSCALVKKGYSVDVASAGGTFENELKSCGIGCYNYPLNKRNISDMIKSYRGLKKLIEDNRYDVVHAHARIPAFICGLLSKRMDFTFVTTCHWVFENNFISRMLTDWGTATLAVSEDIRKYLMKVYGVYPSNIRVTVNGVDCAKFSPDAGWDALRSEFSVEPGYRKIVCVSRLDKSRGDMPLMLARISGRLYRDFPGCRIYIVGGSALSTEDSVAGEIKGIIARNTEKYGYSNVVMCGPRKDISSFTSMADIFVGASRAALEAMAAGCPVILGGNEGYCGICGKKELEKQGRVNFCCRGSKKADENVLYADIVKLLSMPPEELSAIGKTNRDFVKENYSVERMAEDAEKIYEQGSIVRGRSDIVISGYYGFRNPGDDSIIETLKADLLPKLPDGTVVSVLAKSPSQSEKQYGLQCIGRFDIFGILKHFRHAKVLISGGGNLFQNGTSDKSLMYYTGIIRLASAMGLKVVVYSNGVGPLYGRRADNMVKKALTLSDYVSFREPDSFGYARDVLKVRNGVRLTSDPAFIHSSERDSRIPQIIGGGKLSRGFFAVVLREISNRRTRPDRDSAEYFESDVAGDVREISEKYGLTPVFVSFQPGSDDGITNRVASSVPGSVRMFNLSPSEIMELFAESKFVCGMRLHSLVFSASVSVPFVALSYDDKVRSFADYCGMPYVIEAPNGFEARRLVTEVSRVMTEYDSCVPKLKEKSASFRKLAESDTDMIAGIYGSVTR